MNAYKVALLKKEFPFLEVMFDQASLSPEAVTDIKIRRGDKALLAKKGSEDSYSWEDGGHHDYTKFFAVWTTTEGEQEVSELASAGCWATGSGEHSEWDAPTIGEQLFGKGITPDFVVECVKNDTDNNGNGEISRFWTVYKMQRFDLAGYHQEQIDRFAAELKAEIAAACA